MIPTNTASDTPEHPGRLLRFEVVNRSLVAMVALEGELRLIRVRDPDGPELSILSDRDKGQLACALRALQRDEGAKP